jgi:hypothetical protein
MLAPQHIDTLKTYSLVVTEGNSALLNRILDYEENWCSVAIENDECKFYGQVKLAPSAVAEMAIVVDRIGKLSDEPGSRMVTFSPEAAKTLKEFLTAVFSRRERNPFAPEAVFPTELEVVFETDWIVCR